MTYALSRRSLLTAFLGFSLLGGDGAAAQPTDALPSWNDGAAKNSIVDFVARVTTPGGTDFVPRRARHGY